MDTVFIKGLGVKTVIGIHDWERNIQQHLLIDLELATDIRPAADGDDIERTVNYQIISERVIEFIRQSSYGLIETLAEQLASVVMNEFSVPWLRLTVRKPDAIAEAECVGVVIERGRRNAPLT